MSETLLTVSSVPTIRVVLKDISPRRGVGFIRLTFTFEVNTKQQSAVGHPAWLTGHVDLQNPAGHATPHLGSFAFAAQPLVLPPLGSEGTLQLTLDVTDRQLQLIEESRTAGVQLYLRMSGYLIQDGQYATINEGQFLHDIGQSDWIMMLQRAGYRRQLLLELDPPDPQAHPDLAEAIDSFLKAQQRYSEGEWRLTVEALRQSLAALVGMKADDEEQAEDIQDALKDLRKAQTGYEPRLELVRRATKLMCDLGAHPETAETRRHHAYGALLMVGGLLHALSTS